MAYMSLLLVLALMPAPAGADDLTCMLQKDVKQRDGPELLQVSAAAGGQQKSASGAAKRRHEPYPAWVLSLATQEPHGSSISVIDARQEPQEPEGAAGDVEMPSNLKDVHGDKGMRSVEGLAQHVMLPAMAIFLLCIIIGNTLSISPWFHWVPESASTLVVAILMGLAVRRAMETGLMEEKMFTFSISTLLNLVLLPIIIFQSGWSLRTKDFVSQFEYILIFAIFGTLVSTFFIGYSLMYISKWFAFLEEVTLRESLAFASLISAVDPVATLSTYAEMDMPSTQPLLNIMVFGESAINDAVAIVLFEVFNEGWEGFSYTECGLHMSKLLFGSIIFGALVSAVLIFMMRIARLPGHTNAEILYIWACAYFIFALCEATGFSGIIAVLFSGIIFGIYGRKHLTASASTMADDYFELCGKTADASVFILCGTSTALIKSHRGIYMGGIGIILCLIGRALSVSSCGAACNALKRMEGESHPLDFRTQLMMWHGGLRGGIALVLALELNEEWCSENTKGLFVNATFIIICAFLLGLGSTTELMIHALGFSQDKVSEDALIDTGRWYSRIFAKTDTFLMWILVGEDRHHKDEPAPGAQGKLKAHLAANPRQTGE